MKLKLWGRSGLRLLIRHGAATFQGKGKMKPMRRAILLKATLGLFCLGQLIHAAEKPNVVIFFTDDQGTLDARCYGSDHLRTPNLDKLAATGVRFTQAYAHSFCCPSRAALLTGRQPQRGG